MASIHKKSGSWYIAYTDGQKVRHFVTSGYEHSPLGLDGKVDRRQAKENKAKALSLANDMELTSQGRQRTAVVRKRVAEILARARKIDAEQSGLTVKGYSENWVREKLPNVSLSYGAKVALCNTEFCESLEGRSGVEIVHVDEEDIFGYVD